jgi:hypothetical protein
VPSFFHLKSPLKTPETSAVQRHFSPDFAQFLCRRTAEVRRAKSEGTSKQSAKVEEPAKKGHNCALVSGSTMPTVFDKRRSNPRAAIGILVSALTLMRWRGARIQKKAQRSFPPRPAILAAGLLSNPQAELNREICNFSGI